MRKFIEPNHPYKRTQKMSTRRAEPFDPALFEQELESGCIPKIQEGSASMQDYESSQQEEKDVEIPYSVHGLPSLFDNRIF